MSDYYDLGTYSRPVTTGSAEAQRWFNRGLAWTYGYNHDEAIACYGKALDADPTCAMAGTAIWPGIRCVVGRSFGGTPDARSLVVSPPCHGHRDVQLRDELRPR